MMPTTIADKISEAQLLKDRERDYLRAASRFRSLAREAAFFGEDSVDAHLDEAHKFTRMANICALAAEDALASSDAHSFSLNPSDEEKEKKCP